MCSVDLRTRKLDRIQALNNYLQKYNYDDYEGLGEIPALHKILDVDFPLDQAKLISFWLKTWMNLR